MPTRYKVIGLMSGTSLDGLDMACCGFWAKGGKWEFKIEAGQTLKYSPAWRARLAGAHLLTGEGLQGLDNDFGFFIGRACNTFIKRNQLKGVRFIASHGHTVFHQPKRKLTYQLGSGNAIHLETGLPVVNDFRSLDVLKGGEGAPLVPIGDHLLFSRFDVCLNLGGIANLSINKMGEQVAFDVCFANMGLNYLAGKINKAYDKGGKEASRGSVDKNLLGQLKGQYMRWKKNRPSLGREGFEKSVQPLLDNGAISIPDRLRTMVESIAFAVSDSLPSKSNIRMLVTGGGAMNTLLIKCIQEKVGNRAKVVVPEASIVNYKEAVVFALLGVLRVRHEVNVWGGVTGSPSDSCAGTMIGF